MCSRVQVSSNWRDLQYFKIIDKGNLGSPSKTKQGGSTRCTLARKLESANCRRLARTRTEQKELKVVKKMCVSKDIWMCLLSAAIGGIISFLMLKFWNSPRTEAKRRPKIPVEHDERQG